MVFWMYLEFDSILNLEANMELKQSQLQESVRLSVKLKDHFETYHYGSHFQLIKVEQNTGRWTSMVSAKLSTWQAFGMIEFNTIQKQNQRTCEVQRDYCFSGVNHCYFTFRLGRVFGFFHKRVNYMISRNPRPVSVLLLDMLDFHERVSYLLIPDTNIPRGTRCMRIRKNNLENCRDRSTLFLFSNQRMKKSNLY